MAACVQSKEPTVRPKVGVGVFITSPDHPKCVIIGKRKNALGHGHYALPGGHLEFAESWAECATRETFEETGLQLRNVTFETAINVINEVECSHYIVIVMKAEVDPTYRQDPVNMEPHKCEGWEWCHWNAFPERKQLFRALRILREDGYDPFIAKN